MSGKIGGLCVAIGLVCVAVWLTWQQVSYRQALEEALAQANASLEQLRVDHRDTMDAINHAVDLKETINEQHRIHEKQLNQALANDRLANEPLGDDIRMRLQWDENGGKIPPPAKPAPANPDTRSGKDPHSGRYGADDR